MVGTTKPTPDIPIAPLQKLAVEAVSYVFSLPQAQRSQKRMIPAVLRSLVAAYKLGLEAKP